MIETYQRIIDDLSIVNLRNEVKQFYPLRPNGFTTNKWIGIHDEPENTIEKYIQDSYDFYLASQCKYEYRNGLNSGVVGFEWWIEYISTYNEGIPFCSSHDEKVREDEEGKMSYPLYSTMTDLTMDLNPTIIFNTRNGQHINELLEFPPSEVYFSLQEEGKFVTYDPSYIRGVYSGSKDERITLCYDVWDYKPKGLDRVGIVSKPFDCRFYKVLGSPPVTWLGQTNELTTDMYERRCTFKFPTKYNEGETWKVTQ